MVGVGDFVLKVDTCQGMATGPASPEKILASNMSEDFHASSIQAAISSVSLSNIILATKT